MFRAESHILASPSVLFTLDSSFRQRKRGSRFRVEWFINPGSTLRCRRSIRHAVQGHSRTLLILGGLDPCTRAPRHIRVSGHIRKHAARPDDLAFSPHSHCAASCFRLYCRWLSC
jgi:hypothetical protein